MGMGPDTSATQTTADIEIEIEGGGDMIDIGQSKTKSSAQIVSPLDQIEAMLDYIRANLNLTRYTWGVASPQYLAATEIMQKYFNENVEKLNLNVQEATSGLEDLLAQLSLDQTKPS